jgi:hypothetical protein
LKFTAVFFLILMWCSVSLGLIPDRRPDVTIRKPGFALVPVYGHIPGIGNTYGLGFSDQNLWNSHTDFTALVSVGDISAAVFQLNDIRMLDDHLVFGIIGYGAQYTFNIFDRGGFSTSTDYFASQENEYGGAADLALKFWKERIQIYGHLGTSRMQVGKIVDPAGNTFGNNDVAYHDVATYAVGANLDLTDDVWDPHEGLLLQAKRYANNIYDPSRSLFYMLNLEGSYYIPVGWSTWVFDYFRSSSLVTEQSSMNQTQLQQSIGLNCNYTDPAVQSNCQQAQARRINERIAENEYGTAARLGGSNFLRGFVSGRISGSQTEFWGTEFRWNITHGGQPFDYEFLQGFRSSFQLAAFYELGRASDPPLPVEEAPWRSSYGAGVRLLFSGLVLRGDVGFSDEGPQLTLFVGYPW